MAFVTSVTKEGAKTQSITDYFLERRTLFFNAEVFSESAGEIIQALLFLDSVSSEPIKIYIDSPGGAVTAGLAILDIMQTLQSPIITVGVGMAASMGAVLLSAGTKGKRFAYRHTQIMIHQPSCAMMKGGDASDIEITAQNVRKSKNILNEILSLNTGQPVEKINADCERDYFMSAEEALSYGLIDEILH